MNAEAYDEGIVIRDVKDFDLVHIFDCGQCFRWKQDEDGSWVGTASGRTVRMSTKGNDLYIKGATMEDADFWANYLDLDRDYGKIKEVLAEDKVLGEAMEHGSGIRVLKQDPYETTISFIISANNRIPMIKRAVENISKRYGDKIMFEGKEYYSFPDAETLSKVSAEDLKECGCGFRGPYIIATSQKIASGEVDLKKIEAMDCEGAHKALMELPGIGPKVSDCIILFSMRKYRAFPVDIWVKRVMQYFYVAPDVSLPKIRKFGQEKYGDLAGFAQQYLFYFARDLKGKKGLEK